MRVLIIHSSHAVDIYAFWRWTFEWFMSRLCYSVASVLVCLSVVCTEYIVAKRCVLEQKLLLRAYRKSYMKKIDWYRNEWPWPLFRGRIKVMSTIALHWTLNISETFRDRPRGFVPKDHQQEMAWAIKWSCARWRQVTPKVLWGSTVSYPSDSLASCLVNDLWSLQLLFRSRVELEVCGLRVVPIASQSHDFVPWKIEYLSRPTVQQHLSSSHQPEHFARVTELSYSFC